MNNKKISICLDSEWSSLGKLITLQLKFYNIIVIYYNKFFFKEQIEFEEFSKNFALKNEGKSLYFEAIDPEDQDQAYWLDQIDPLIQQPSNTNDPQTNKKKPTLFKHFFNKYITKEIQQDKIQIQFLSYFSIRDYIYLFGLDILKISQSKIPKNNYNYNYIVQGKSLKENLYFSIQI